MFNQITVYHFLVLSSILFSISVVSMLSNRKNIIGILISIELMLLSTNLMFVSFSSFLNDLTGQIMAIFVLTVAGAEAAIGLAIALIYFKNRGSIDVDDATSLNS